ncbi:MAG: hypothetical protein JW893_09005 [Candidatus Omnitrophica bacterium]|nr:hypothetical protein [Candidatus Omnitrophota bacterium]
MFKPTISEREIPARSPEASTRRMADRQANIEVGDTVKPCRFTGKFKWKKFEFRKHFRFNIETLESILFFGFRDMHAGNIQSFLRAVLAQRR